ASAIFLAKYMLLPGKRPWYKPSELCERVKVLHHLFCNSSYCSLPAIRKKYCQHKLVTCMMIAAQCVEICVPQVEEYCYITDNTYFKEEVLQVESVMFEMRAPTAKCFLRRFAHAANGNNEVCECLNPEGLHHLFCNSLFMTSGTSTYMSDETGGYIVGEGSA
ncbi:Cyclin a1, partial [Thalictrum thalictroides]